MTEGPPPRDPREEPPREPLGGPEAPADRPPAVFRALPGRPDVLRTVSGREAGELLRLTRDDTGAIVRMHWATYRFTRVQEAFDGGPAWDGPEDASGR